MYYVCIYIYICIYIHISLSIYTYIYIYYIYIYVYIYTYTQYIRFRIRIILLGVFVGLRLDVFPPLRAQPVSILLYIYIYTYIYIYVCIYILLFYMSIFILLLVYYAIIKFSRRPETWTLQLSACTCYAVFSGARRSPFDLWADGRLTVCVGRGVPRILLRLASLRSNVTPRGLIAHFVARAEVCYEVPPVGHSRQVSESWAEFVTSSVCNYPATRASSP